MPKLLDEVRHLIRLRHYSYRTEKTYAHLIKRFIIFHGKRHARGMSHASGNPGLCPKAPRPAAYTGG